MNVVQLKRENWRDAARTLRLIADQLDSGELPECEVGVLSMIGSGRTNVFGFGRKADDLQCIAAMRLAERKLIDAMTCSEDELED